MMPVLQLRMPKRTAVHVVCRNRSPHPGFPAYAEPQRAANLAEMINRVWPDCSPHSVGPPRRTVARTISLRELRLTRRRPLAVLDGRPATRSECVNAVRPCPWVACKWHLYLDVNSTGSIKINYPELQPWQMGQSCTLDVADAGGVTLDAVGDLLNLTRERARQLQESAIDKIRDSLRFALEEDT